MKKTILLIPIIFCLWASGQTPSNDPHWQLEWEDNFNFFDNTKWVKAHYCDHYGEPQLYLEQNVWTSGGNLVIKVNNYPAYCPSNPPTPTAWACGSCNEGVHDYTSGWVETKQAYDTQYGYIEARIKLPYQDGFWPAFWTWRGSGATNDAEIDIFEMIGGDEKLHSPHITTTNVHLNYSGTSNYPGAHKLNNFSYTDWHVYAIEWSPSKIIWYIDGSPIRLLPNPGVTGPIRIILNHAIDWDSLPPISPHFNYYMYVDFVKVYKLNNDCNTNINVCNYNFSTHDNRVKKSITIGNVNGSCINSIEPGKNVYLRASEGVLINGDFTVPVGAELYIDVNPCY